MEELLHQLFSKRNCKITPLITPKYHPEIATEGIEYAWRHTKRYFRSIPFKMKNTKKKFAKAIKDNIKYVSVKNINSFARQCRRYMLAYKHECRQTRDSPPSLTYESIEKFQKICKMYRNPADQDKGFKQKYDDCVCLDSNVILIYIKLIGWRSTELHGKYVVYCLCKIIFLFFIYMSDCVYLTVYR